MLQDVIRNNKFSGCQPLYHLFSLLAWIVFMTGMSQLSVAGETINNHSHIDLVRQYQNPLARFTRVQIEDNAQFGFGPNNEVLNFLRLQPLIPIQLNQQWDIVTRLVIPIMHLPWPESTDGLSDIGLQVFLTPAQTGKLIWGIGSSFLFPTATHEMLGTEKWSAGPAAAVVYINGHWIIGAVGQNIFSFAGDDSRQDVNAMTIRPIVNYTLPNGWYLTSSPTIAADWEADKESRWLVPVGGGIGKVLKIGRQQMSAVVEAYHHAKSPEIGPDWQLRLQFTLLFPE
jgi:hypothetical protein